MKDLLFASLRGTRTAIHCSTKSEAEQVEKICGFEGVAKYWHNKESKYCISLCNESIDEKGTYGGLGYLKSGNYTIIPAAEFIAANSGLNSIDTKPVKNRDIGRNEAREIIGTMSANHKSEPVVIKREAEPPKNEFSAVEWFFDKIKSHFEHDGDLFESLTFTLAIAKQKEREQHGKTWDAAIQAHDDEQWDEPEPCPTCGDFDGMVNPCCAGYDPLHYKNCGYG